MRVLWSSVMKSMILLHALIPGIQPMRLFSEKKLAMILHNYMIQNISTEIDENLKDVFKINHHLWIQNNLRTGLPKISFTSSLKWLECHMCIIGFQALFFSFNIVSDGTLTAALSTVCHWVTSFSMDVCRGLLSRNLPIIRHVYENTREATARSFCSLVLQTDEPNAGCEILDSRFDWSVKLPPPPTSKRSFLPRSPEARRSRASSGGIKIALVGDPHVDMLYQPNSVADCHEPLCCRGDVTPRTYPNETHHPKPVNITRRMFYANETDTYIDLDILYDFEKALELLGKGGRRHKPVVTRDSSPAGFWGDYRKCDTPPWAFENALEEISKHRDINMVYYMGDAMDHFVWKTTHDAVRASESYIEKKMRAAFGGTLIIPIVGNHESHPVDIFAPPSVTGPLNSTWIYELMADKWGPYLDKEAEVTLRAQGDFAMTVRPDFKIISLNNNIANNLNWWLVYDPKFPKKHLEWLVEELLQAELMEQKVHILTHIPPGIPDLMYTWTREYKRIVLRFASTIAAEFNGHTHSDEFKLYYDSRPEPVAVAWNAGGVTTYMDFNLNYKILQLESRSYRLQKMQSFVYNLTEANMNPHEKPRWFQMYDFSERYDLVNLQPKSLGDLMWRMVTTEKHLVDEYYTMFMKASTAGDTCEIECRLHKICNVVTTELWNLDVCKKLLEKYKRNI